MAHKLASELGLEGLVEVAEGLGAFPYDLGGDLIGHCRGGCALAGGEGEDVGLGEGDLTGQFEGLFEFSLGFARENYDNIGRLGRAAMILSSRGVTSAGFSEFRRILGGSGTWATFSRRLGRRLLCGLGHWLRRMVCCP